MYPNMSTLLLQLLIALLTVCFITTFGQISPQARRNFSLHEETLRRQFAKMQLRRARGIKEVCLENSPEECSLYIPTQICIHFIV